MGFDGFSRYMPSHDIEVYIKDPLQRKVEKLSSEDLNLEKLFLGFRSKVGVRESVLTVSQRQKAQLLLKEGMLFYENGRYFCSDFFLADEIVLFLS